LEGVKSALARLTPFSEARHQAIFEYPLGRRIDQGNPKNTIRDRKKIKIFHILRIYALQKNPPSPAFAIDFLGRIG